MAVPMQPSGASGARSFETAVSRGGLRESVRRRVLDVGAGNGWLSSRLSELGHETVAVDLDDDAGDGLGAAAPRTPFPLVQADFDAMPFAPGQFDLVLMNASLHYSPDPERTVEAAARLLRPGGTLMVMDSPLFEDPADGEAMVAQQLEALSSSYSIEQPIRPGVGFLTFGGLQRIASRIGRSAGSSRRTDQSSGAAPGLERQRLGRSRGIRCVGRPILSFNRFPRHPEAAAALADVARGGRRRA